MGVPYPEGFWREFHATRNCLQTTLPPAFPAVIAIANAAVGYARHSQRSSEDYFDRWGYAGVIRTALECLPQAIDHDRRGGNDCSSHLPIIDAPGSMASMTNTPQSRFRSKVTQLTLGSMASNRMMRCDPGPGTLIAVAPNADPCEHVQDDPDP